MTKRSVLVVGFGSGTGARVPCWLALALERENSRPVVPGDFVGLIQPRQIVKHPPNKGPRNRWGGIDGRGSKL